MVAFQSCSFFLAHPVRSVVCIWHWIINIIIGPYGCTPCPMGKYKADKGNGQCIGCPMGNTTMMMGSKKCNILEGTLFFKYRNISTHALMLLSKSQIFGKITLRYLTKGAKCYLERVNSFCKGFVGQLSI